MTGSSGNVPTTSEDSRRLSEDFRTFEHFRSYLEDNSFSVLSFRQNTEKDTKSSFNAF